MRAWLFILGVAAGCSSTNVVVCNLDEFLQSDVAGRGEVTACGACAFDGPDAGAPATPAAMQQCALDAVAAGHAFTLCWDVPDPTGAQVLRGGFSGYVTGNGTLIVHEYGFSAKAPEVSDPTVTRSTCLGTPAVVDVNTSSTPCTPGPGNLCLACNQRVSGTVLCGFQP